MKPLNGKENNMPIPDFQSVMLPLLKFCADGQQLAQLMIDFAVGVAADAKYELKRLDLDYFTES
jgi:restriction endonuclease Mrr